MIKIKANGAPQYMKKLDKLGRSMSELEIPTRDAGEVAVAAVKSYPRYGDWKNKKVSSDPNRPGSKYKRTFNLQKSMTGRMQKSGKVVKYLVYQGNKGRAPYIDYVIGDAQVPLHAGYWITLSQWEKILHPVALDIFRKWYKSLK